MELNKRTKNKKTFFLITAGIFIVTAYVAMRIFSDERESILLFIGNLISPYFSLAEFISNNVIKLFVDGVSIQNHKIIFNSYNEYFQTNRTIVENWTIDLLYYKWSAFLLLSFWLAHSTLKKKVKYTFFLFVTHLFAVISGLVMIAGIGPILKNPESIAAIGHDTIGIIALFVLFAVWVRNSRTDIKLAFNKIKVNFSFSDKKTDEILVVFFVLILLKNFFIPFFNHDYYILFYLKATKLIVSLFGYSADINGAYLIGSYGGTLFVAKWCLGVKTMFIFAAMVYLTRRDNKSCWFYIGFGLITLHLLNSLRLSVLFIFVQHNSDSKLITDHHDIYNIVVYFFIFILWIIWFEKFAKIKRKKLETKL